jgi:hypothetical protein
MHGVGVMVSAKAAGEVRYAWVVIGSQQRLYDTVMSDKEVPGQTETAYHQIVGWLREQGFEPQHGCYSFPVGLRLMVATAACTKQPEEIEIHSQKGQEA